MFGYVITLVGACFIPIIESSLSDITIKIRYAVASLVIGLCSITAIFNAPLYFLAIDYGRWVSISLTLVLTTCLLYQKHIATAAIQITPMLPQKGNNLSSYIGSKWLYFVLFFVVGIVRIPHNVDIWRLRFWHLSPLLSRIEGLIDMVTAIFQKHLGGIL